ncbi:glycosyltransferase family 2 protein [Pararhodospirillum oryzae]|uniref:Glycosyltransferase 2-like domain-containing protein n=1 Tax=Pararhodospirillum oryzae TaxID=478448 RepID=A0A512H3X0_9PROT|nr:glycosyltransferase [Pararhodospirillum oryzae]GEO80137.1 hypothetical protein ROR02_02680 [Pararhodospirillum oryzae]
MSESGEGLSAVCDGPRVDVIIAAWNRADTIERAIRSALDQEGLGRVVVVDDASIDDTLARIEALARADARVVAVGLPVNRGPAAARNAALALACAPFVTILDADDYLLPGRLVGLMAWASDQDFVADDLVRVEDHSLGPATTPSVSDQAAFAPWSLDFETFVRGNIARRGRPRRELGFFKPLIRLEFLRQHALAYDEGLRLGEDFDLYARALRAGARFRVVPALGYVSVTRVGSLSGRHGRTDLQRLLERTLALDGPGLSRRERIALAALGRSLDARIQWLLLIDAVKAREWGGMVRPFRRSFTVTGFLLANLGDQVVRRSFSCLRGFWETRR